MALVKLGYMKKACCLCLEIAPLTREHKIKRSLLEYFNNLQNTSQDKALKFDDGTDNGGEFSNIKRARILKPKKNICTACNSSRSADCDPYFDKFVIEAFHWQDNIPEIRAITSPSNEDVLREANHQKGNIINDIDDTLWTNSYLFTCSKYLITSKYQIYTHSYDVQLIKKYLAKHSKSSFFSVFQNCQS